MRAAATGHGRGWCRWWGRRALTWGVGSGSGGAWHGRGTCWVGRRGAAAARGQPGPGARGAAPSSPGSSPSGTPGGSWPSARPPARQSPWRGPAPHGAGARSGSAGQGGSHEVGDTLWEAPRPPAQGSRGATLQVSRRVQIFLVSGFSTPHCLFRSHSFPAGRARQWDAGGAEGGAGLSHARRPGCRRLCQPRWRLPRCLSPPVRSAPGSPPEPGETPPAPGLRLGCAVASLTVA